MSILVLYDSNNSRFFFVEILSGDADTSFKRTAEALKITLKNVYISEIYIVYNIISTHVIFNNPT